MSKKQNKGILIEEHSVNELFDKLDEIIAHQKYTNGKVAENLKQIAEVKSKSWGVWVSNHPIKSIMLVVVLTTLVISDFRHPIIEFLIKLL